MALGKSFHVSELISLPVNWQQQPHLPKEGVATQKRTLAQLTAQRELEIHGRDCVLYRKSPRKRFHAFVGPLSVTDLPAFVTSSLFDDRHPNRRYLVWF